MLNCEQKQIVKFRDKYNRKIGTAKQDKLEKGF
jgi:hypothetical protein